MLIIHNAKIYTQNPAHAFSAALAIDHGYIVAVGSDDEILNAFHTQNKFDAQGFALIPGLTDSHIHLATYALALQKVDCETRSKIECLQRVAERVITALPGEWILGHGWNQNIWADSYGNKGQLDEIAPHHPVYLTHKSLHCSWVNSQALHFVGIDRNTPDPAGGRIGRLENGDPNGILFETASDLVENCLPEPALEQVIKAILSVQPVLWRMGLTGVHDFDGNRCFSALQVIHQLDELKLRVLKSIPMEHLSQAISIGLRTGFGDNLLRIGSVKLFADGALGPHTAAMLQPYSDDPANSGILMMDAEELFEVGQKAASNGISMAIHAIGDRANHEVLNAYAQLREFEKSLKIFSNHQLRHRIEHVQIIHPDDVGRLSELNIVASMQPIHATSDMVMADQFWGTRSALAYAWREQISRGATIVFGSDAPVESPNPFWGIHAAVTRCRADGSPGKQGWYPKQRLTVSEAIRGFTSTPAFAAGLEEKAGKIAPGHFADLTILNENPYTCPPPDLLNIHPLATMVGGNWVFSDMK
jgi:hypothetical protein